MIFYLQCNVSAKGIVRKFELIIHGTGDDQWEAAERSADDRTYRDLDGETKTAEDNIEVTGRGIGFFGFGWLARSFDQIESKLNPTSSPGIS